MKKLFSLALLLALMLSLALSLSSCGANKVDCIDIKLTSESYAYGVSKNNPELLNIVNDVINELKISGELDNITSKYFSGDTENYKYVDACAIDESKKQLIVVTNTPFSPFEFKQGTKYCGIDIEIASIIANRINAQLVIKEKPLNSIIDEVYEGRAHIAMAGLTINDTRKSKVDFSSTYFQASQVIMTRAGDTTFKYCKAKADVESVLSQLDNSTVVGCQAGSTSSLYLKGDPTMGFTGYNLSTKEYRSVDEVSRALINGDVSFAILDQGAAQVILEKVNK